MGGRKKIQENFNSSISPCLATSPYLEMKLSVLLFSLNNTVAQLAWRGIAMIYWP